MSLVGHIYSNDLNDIYYEFYTNCDLFRKFIENRDLMTDEEEQELKTEFKTQFPEKDFDEFLKLKNLNNIDVCTQTPLFDTRSGKTYNNPTILEPIRKKDNSFNIQDFLRESIANNQVYYLNFDPDPPIDIEDEFVEKNSQLAHLSLKSIGEIALVLKGQRKEIPYTLMDVQAENYIH